MSNKQRAKIYRKAAIVFADGKNFRAITCRLGLCGVLRYKVDPPVEFYYDTDAINLPELALFDPKHIPAYWWHLDDKGDNYRILALLLSEQIALNP